MWSDNNYYDVYGSRGPPQSEYYTSPGYGPPPASRDNYPGEYRHHSHHHHHNQGGYGGDFAPQNDYDQQSYYPSQGYAPPSGPPPGVDGYGYTTRGPPQLPPSHHQYYGPQGSNQQQFYFKYSQCTGRKKALCIGINYFGTSNELRGCINDAHNVERFLISQFGFQPDDIVILTDDSSHPRSIPTRDNMLSAMQWLVRDAQPHDSLFFHYSGHGGQTKDLDGDEDDGYDEVIYPVDFQQSGHIVDDLMHDIMVKSLPAGCRLTAIYDSCHSGTALDLPFIYSTEGKIKEPNLAAEAGQDLLTAAESYTRGDMGGVMTSVKGLFHLANGDAQRAEQISRRTKTSPADCISFSGCKDSQTSADTEEAGTATGAMSYAFISALSQNPQQSYQQLLVSLRGILAREHYTQKPQLSSSHPMDTNILFIA